MDAEFVLFQRVGHADGLYISAGGRMYDMTRYLRSAPKLDDATGEVRVIISMDSIIAL